MPTEQLREDLKGIAASLRSLASVSAEGDALTAATLQGWIKDNLLPFMDAQIDEIDEIDGAVEGLVNNTESILQPEDAGVLAAPIVHGRALANVLSAKLDLNNPKDQKIKKGIVVFLGYLSAAEQLIAAITVDDEEEVDPEPAPTPESVDPANDNDEEGGDAAAE